MRILIVGNGGREHVLLWKLKRDAAEAEFFATRPNGGMAELASNADVDPTDAGAISEWAVREAMDLVVVGPEAPLAAGLVDRLTERGVPAFGPTAAAARIESSKVFAKDLLERAGVPTARHRAFAKLSEAERYLRDTGAPIVVKASGLAGGKGAIVCEELGDALGAVREMLAEGRFGEAGRQVVIEEYMRGEELSLFALTDGEAFLTMLPSQDHKRIGEGDTGPNTGGMGSYAPVSIANTGLVREVEERIIAPTLEALRAVGSPFRGLLYAGLMLTEDGPRVVEYNCRFGDPESQAVLPLLESSLLEPLLAVARGESVGGGSLRWRPGASITTVLASAGYPGRYETGFPVEVPPDLRDGSDVLLFHAGTRREGEILLTSGGRVMAVTGIGESLPEAAERSRAAAAAVQFRGKVYRHDIGWRELARWEAESS